MLNPDLLWRRGSTRHQLYLRTVLSDRGRYEDMTGEAIARCQLAERQLVADPDRSGDYSYAFDGTIEDDRRGVLYGLAPGSCYRLADPDLFCGVTIR